MNMKNLSVCIICLFSLILPASIARAQTTTGSISGTVADSKGGVVPNVTVTLTNEDTHVIVRTRSPRTAAASMPLPCCPSATIR
jgi:predicted S18 family serine protease